MRWVAIAQRLRGLPPLAAIVGRALDLERPTKVEARDGYEIWLEYANGLSSKIGLSDVGGNRAIDA